MRNALKWLSFGLAAVLFLTFFGHPDAALAMSAPAHGVGLQHIAPFMLVGAIGKYSDMVVYQEEFQTGLVESVTQFLGVFNEGSRGAIRLVPRALKGHYSKGAFFKDVASLVTRRDITSTAAVTALALQQDEQIGVKLNRKVGPVAQTLDAMKKANLSVADASRVFGVMAGQRKMKDMLNAGLIAVETAIQAVTANNISYAATSTTAKLQAANALFGDASQDIVCWVSHSKPNHDIVAALMAGSVTGLTDIATIQGAIPAYLGRPSVITDSPALTDAGTPATYNTLGLVANAVLVEESEDETYFTDLVGGSENLYQIFQAEYAFNITIKGHKWDVTNGGINPADATLATTTNWDKVASDDKLTAGVRLVTQ